MSAPVIHIGPDYLSEDGAKELARRIHQFWLAKTRKSRAGVRVHIEKIDWTEKKNGRAVWCVRSNLVRGLPQGG
jgi:hypothetical protein